MLQTLNLRDFVIVDALEIDFEPGFTVLSGETGAGKSILVDALAIVLGERADASVVREGANRAEISARFEATDEATAWLDSNDLADGTAVLLRRVVDSAGRSKAWVNGAPVTIAQLRDLAQLLVDIHGQHAHQSLLRANAQRALLDGQAGLLDQVRLTAIAWRTWQDLRTQLELGEKDAKNLESERDRLTWQVEELSRLNPQPQEWQNIQQEHQRLSNAASLIAGAQASIQTLSDDDDAVSPMLAMTISRLKQFAQLDPALDDVLELLVPAQIQIEDAVRTLNHYLARSDIDPARLAEVDARIQAIHTTARKFRLPPEELQAALLDLRTQLDALENVVDREALRRAEETARAHYFTMANELSVGRARAAASLSQAVTEGMQSLSMAGGRFEISLEADEPGPSGLERVEFLVAAHVGAMLRPLAKVASGGELARISLAISVIASTATTVPTLVFDEVDSGIGGAVAEVVGRLLRQLGHLRQVLCVTHLPQVAAQGDHHFAVSKISNGERTVSQVKALGQTERVDEVARMLGGIDITATTRRHARELLSTSG